jgi:hypothetical protein
MSIEKEQQRGSFKEKCITNGGQLPLSCGYMASVRPYLVVLRFMGLNLYSGLWKEHYMVCECSSLIFQTG